MSIENVQKITLDFCRNNIQSVSVKQYDKNTRYLIVSCTENGKFVKLDKSYMTCRVKVLTPDDRASLDTCTILDDGTVKVPLTENVLFSSGVANAELMITSSDESKRIGTMKFRVIIDSSVYGDERVISSDEFSALTELFEKADKDYIIVITEAKKSADAAKMSATNAKTSETNAKNSETNASSSATTASSKADEASASAESASKSENVISVKASEINQKANDIETIKSDVQNIASDVSDMRDAVSEDKTIIEDTIKNSLLASSEEILAAMKDSFDRAQELYNTMYIDCDGETPQQRVVTIVSIDCSTPQSRLHDTNGILFNGGTPLNRQLAS